MKRADCLYQAFYCEENIWHLNQDQRFQDLPRRVLFISNDQRCLAMRNQRIVEAGEWCFWDYHVVFAVCRAAPGPGGSSRRRWLIYDLDSHLPFPCPLPAYLKGSFGFPGLRLTEQYAPKFRVIDGPEYAVSLASDRSHMRQNGEYREPPPPWPLIQRPDQTPGHTEHRLDEFIDPLGAGPGKVVSLSMLNDALH